MGSMYHRPKAASNARTKARSENAYCEAQRDIPKRASEEAKRIRWIMAQIDDENRRLRLFAEELRAQIARLATTRQFPH